MPHMVRNAPLEEPGDTHQTFLEVAVERGYERRSFIGRAPGRPRGIIMSHDRQNLRPTAGL